MESHDAAPRHVFISYSRRDSGEAGRLATALKDAGYSIWFDQRSIQIGARWKRSIERAVMNSQAMVVLLSSDALSSEYVKYEIEKSSHHRVPIYPLTIGNLPDRSIPAELRCLQIVDLRRSFAQGVAKLVAAISSRTISAQIYDVRNNANLSETDKDLFSAAYRSKSIGGSRSYLAQELADLKEEKKQLESDREALVLSGNESEIYRQVLEELRQVIKKIRYVEGEIADYDAAHKEAIDSMQDANDRYAASAREFLQEHFRKNRR